ncbi:glycerophosphotransferase [Nocardiopsis composta]|uniref:CDP-Glycerol:Poly(Glycerophosphate) glycerophosphotransferase n=1 Tax=Nocardiopsis composta TaxID=157465 RepID=A0A7W8QPL4_9ACTN|nr:glycerophosphotransferase [Nocardiopsis composta]MBB5434308.1 hypothetical protein [Nocardiopsis composta]
MSAPHDDSEPVLLPFLAYGFGYFLLLIGALLASPAPFALGLVLCYGTEVLLMVRAERAAKVLSQLRFGITSRALLRQLLVLGLLADGALAGGTGFWWVLICFALLFGLQFCYGYLARRLRSMRRLPVVTRNIDLGPLRVTDAPPRVLVHDVMARLLLLDLPLLAGAVLYTATGAAAAVAVGGALSLAATLVPSALLLRHLLRDRTIASPAEAMEHVQRWLDSYRPEVVLYFSGSADSAYQVNMWLEAVRALPRRSVVVLRERAVAAQLAATPLPVLCVPVSTDIMALDFGPARVALYPANTGKNIHMLRNPQMRHVFIGHGDSDKIASVNPFSKVYDEVWTAGRAGRDRYALAAVGVRDETIVEVGRPQLSPVRPDTAPRSRPTVLYAPTWEGWTDEPGNTSLIEAGPAIVRALLAAEPGVRVIYKPHPFTGIRSAAARAAHRRITELLAAAGSGTGARPASPRLAGLEARLNAFDTLDESVDEAQRSRDAGRPGASDADEIAGLTAEWHRLFWESKADGEHLVVQGPRPSLYSCFNEADLLISDISSVVADFVSSGKPYAIANCEGITDEEFRAEHPTSGAAFLLAPDAGGLDEALDAARAPGTDRFADARLRLREYLLGPDLPPSQERFAAAVDDLYERTARLRPLDDPAGLHERAA